MKPLRLGPAVLVVYTAIVFTGCMVGPTYKQPAAPVTPAYKEPPPDSFKESDQWKTSKPNADALRGKWWEIFGDPQLNALEEQVTVSNQNLKMADARFRQARTLVRYNRASEFPTISVAPDIQALRFSPNQPYFPSNVGTGGRAGFNLPFDLSYEVDLWGRIRRTVTSAGGRRKLPRPISRPSLSVFLPNWRWTTMNCAAPMRKKGCSMTR
jgi:outer membrane protein TolC